jgi:hypothetical protein
MVSCHPEHKYPPRTLHNLKAELCKDLLLFFNARRRGGCYCLFAQRTFQTLSSANSSSHNTVVDRLARVYIGAKKSLTDVASRKVESIIQHCFVSRPSKLRLCDDS